jgi:Type IV secretory system Conjugative DNA transfer
MHTPILNRVYVAAAVGLVVWLLTGQALALVGLAGWVGAFYLAAQRFQLLMPSAAFWNRFGVAVFLAWALLVGYLWGVTLLGGLMIVAAAVGIYVGLLPKFRKLPEMPKPYNARFARVDEVAALAFDSQKGNGVLLGISIPASSKDTPERLAVQPGALGMREYPVLLYVGRPGTGKSQNLKSNLLDWGRHGPGSVLVNDVSGELYKTTGGARAALGPVWVLDPDGYGSRYDPFRDLALVEDRDHPGQKRISEEGVREAARLVMRYDEMNGDSRQFALAGSNLLEAMIRAAILEGRPVIAAIRELVASGSPKAASLRLLTVRDDEVRRKVLSFVGDHPNAKNDEYWSRGNLTTHGWSNLVAALEPYMTEGVMRLMSGSDFEAADLQRQPSSVYMTFPETSKALRPVYQFVVTAMTTALKRAKLGPRVPLLLGFDEAGVTPIPDLPELVATARKYWMALMIYVQDLSQIEGNPSLNRGYGRDGKDTILGSAHVQIFTPSEHEGTLKYIVGKLGKVSVLDIRLNSSGSESANGFTYSEGQARGYRERELVTPDELRQWHPDNVIIFAQGFPPIGAHRIIPEDVPNAAALQALPAPEVQRIHYVPNSKIFTDALAVQPHTPLEREVPVTNSSRRKKARDDGKGEESSVEGAEGDESAQGGQYVDIE